MSNIAKYMLSADAYQFAITWKSKKGVISPPTDEPGWHLVCFSATGGFEGDESMEESKVAILWARELSSIPEEEDEEEESEDEEEVVVEDVDEDDDPDAEDDDEEDSEDDDDDDDDEDDDEDDDDDE
jgi:phosphopantothenoylcysteine synthetase/decarboxylase